MTYGDPARVLAWFASVLGMSKESLLELLQQMDECVELLQEADKRQDAEGFMRLTSDQTAKLIAVIRDAAGIIETRLIN